MMNVCVIDVRSEDVLRSTPWSRGTGSQMLPIPPKATDQRIVADMLFTMVAFPTLIMFGLLLEAKMHTNWMLEPTNRWVVLALLVGLLITTIVICGYVTHRIGVHCLWAGPQHMECTQEQQRFNAMCRQPPPSYEAAMSQPFELPPPAYESISVLGRAMPQSFDTKSQQHVIMVAHETIVHM